IRRALASIKGLTYFFIDTCHSGDALGRPGLASTDTTRMINDLSSAENGVVIFASSTGEQVSYENPAWANGAFTEALVDGFRGEAALTNREYITVGMLNVFVSERVQDLTGGEQTPTSAIPNLIPDLHIALRR
ncbi:MAG: caspase family protein, partial [Rhodospirillales bacterium]|nr:caspase family protein [Rhodospirillales bacterium]